MPVNSMVRTFIALDISSGVRDEIRKAIAPIRRQFPKIRWVEDRQFHVTLKFLGDVSLTDIYHVVGATQRACSKVSQFDLVFEGIGAFPDAQSPRSLWVGVQDGVEEVRRLAELIEEELIPLGYPAERRLFMPHLTIGRSGQAFRRGQKSADSQMSPLTDLVAAESDRYFGCSAVDEVVVYSSELSRNGPQYEVLSTIALSPISKMYDDQ